MAFEEYTKEKLIDFADIAYMDLVQDKDLKGITIEDILKNKKYWENYDLKEQTGELQKRIDYYSSVLGEYKKYEILDYTHEHTDKESGFGAIALKAPNGDIIVAFRGSDGGLSQDMIRHNVRDMPNFYKTNQGQKAENFLGKILEENPDCNVIVSGHSLGGYLSQVASIENLHNTNIKQVFGFDSPGFEFYYLKQNQNKIDDFLERGGKWEVLEMTLVSKLLKQFENIKIKYLERNDEFGFSEVVDLHVIQNFRKYNNGNKIFKEGRLDYKKNFYKISVGGSTLISALFGKNMYEDINTGIRYGQTLQYKQDYKDGQEFNNSGILLKELEKRQPKKLKENPEYLVRGAILKCTLGGFYRRLDLPICHGVYIKTAPATHEEDSIEGETKNIKSFGVCFKYRNFPVVCNPMPLKKWFLGYPNTYIVRNGVDEDKNGNFPEGDLLKALTEHSFLVCAQGGLIEPVTSGQEFYEDIKTIEEFENKIKDLEQKLKNKQNEIDNDTFKVGEYRAKIDRKIILEKEILKLQESIDPRINENLDLSYINDTNNKIENHKNDLKETEKFLEENKESIKQKEYNLRENNNDYKILRIEKEELEKQKLILEEELKLKEDINNINKEVMFIEEEITTENKK